MADTEVATGASPDEINDAPDALQLQLSPHLSELVGQIEEELESAEWDVVKIGERVAVVKKAAELAIAGVNIEDGTLDHLEDRLAQRKVDAQALAGAAAALGIRETVSPVDASQYDIEGLIAAGEELAAVENPNTERGSEDEASGSGEEAYRKYSVEDLPTVESMPTATVTQRVEAILVVLMRHGGELNVGEEGSASDVVKSELGINQNQWTGALGKARDMNLIKTKTPSKHVRRYSSLEMDDAVLAELVQGDHDTLSSAFKQAAEVYAQIKREALDQAAHDSLFLDR